MSASLPADVIEQLRGLDKAALSEVRASRRGMRTSARAPADRATLAGHLYARMGLSRR